MSSTLSHHAVIAESVARLLRSEHPGVAARVVDAVVADAAGELSGLSGPDFRRRVVVRSSARLAAMTGTPIVITRAETARTATPRWSSVR